jgi:hypothetical protein
VPSYRFLLGFQYSPLAKRVIVGFRFITDFVFCPVFYKIVPFKASVPTTSVWLICPLGNNERLRPIIFIKT